MYFVRKIARAKWIGCDTRGATSIHADAVTGCLRTSKNTLSLWEAQSEEDLSKAVLALVGAIRKDEKIDYVVLEKGELVARGLVVEDTVGDTFVKPLSGWHRDVVNLDIDALKTFAEIVQSKLSSGLGRQLTRPKLAELLAWGINERLLSLDELPEDFKKSVTRALTNSQK